MVKNSPAMQETRFNPWVGKIPWKKEMATHSSVLAWEFHGQKSLEGSQRVKYGLSDQNFTVNHIYKSNKFVGFIVYSITINYIY